MKIYSLAKVLSFPIVVIAGVLAYLEFYTDHSIGMFLLIPLVALVALYILQGEIDYQWHKLHPLPMEEKERQVLERYVPFYSQLSEADQRKFEHRVLLYIDAREIKNRGAKDLVDIPDDIKVLIAAQVIQLTFGRDDFLLKKFDRVYSYKHPFPTPKHQFLHTVEVDDEDGVILFSMEHAIPGMTQSDQYYNVVMHGYAEAFIKQFPDVLYPNIEAVEWKHIEKITGFRKDQILKVLGFEDVDLLPVVINCFFTYPEKTRAVLGKYPLD